MERGRPRPPNKQSRAASSFVVLRNDEFLEKDAARLFQIADVTSALP